MPRGTVGFGGASEGQIVAPSTIRSPPASGGRRRRFELGAGPVGDRRWVAGPRRGFALQRLPHAAGGRLPMASPLAHRLGYSPATCGNLPEQMKSAQPHPPPGCPRPARSRRLRLRPPPPPRRRPPPSLRGRRPCPRPRPLRCGTVAGTGAARPGPGPPGAQGHTSGSDGWPPLCGTRALGVGRLRGRDRGGAPRRRISLASVRRRWGERKGGGGMRRGGRSLPAKPRGAAAGSPERPAEGPSPWSGPCAEGDSEPPSRRARAGGAGEGGEGASGEGASGRGGTRACLLPVLGRLGSERGGGNPGVGVGGWGKRSCADTAHGDGRSQRYYCI